MWTTRKELEATLAQAGLGEWSPRLAAAARHAMILEPGPVEEGVNAPIGASRLGGTPDLPSEVSWPWRSALPDWTVFEHHLARPWPLPPPDTKPAAPWPPRMRWGQEHEAYHQFWENLAKEHPNAFTSHGAIHQVGGIAFPWQDPLETDCVKFADDDYLNHPTVKAFQERIKKDGAPIDWPDYEEAWQAYSAFQARERATHFARADGWQHVLQIETDSEVGPWIGEGCLYVCIRQSDLAKCRFDRCWTMPQCT